MTEQRRLAAILVADVVGYSKLIGGDEAGPVSMCESFGRRTGKPIEVLIGLR